MSLPQIDYLTIGFRSYRGLVPQVAVERVGDVSLKVDSGEVPTPARLS